MNLLRKITCSLVVFLYVFVGVKSLSFAAESQNKANYLTKQIEEFYKIMEYKLIRKELNNNKYRLDIKENKDVKDFYKQMQYKLHREKYERAEVFFDENILIFGEFVDAFAEVISQRSILPTFRISSQSPDGIEIYYKKAQLIDGVDAFYKQDPFAGKIVEDLNTYQRAINLYSEKWSESLKIESIEFNGVYETSEEYLDQVLVVKFSDLDWSFKYSYIKGMGWELK